MAKLSKVSGQSPGISGHLFVPGWQYVDVERRIRHGEPNGHPIWICDVGFLSYVRRVRLIHDVVSPQSARG